MNPIHTTLSLVRIAEDHLAGLKLEGKNAIHVGDVQALLEVLEEYLEMSINEMEGGVING